HVKAIVERMMARGNRNILATRASQEVYQAIKEVAHDAEYHEIARIVVVKRSEVPVSKGKIAVVSAGTSDLPVAEEAAITAEVLGNKVERVYDVGVAGLHRLLANAKTLNEANVVIAVAGMEGALASVIGGLVDKPVIAVPTSVGYGANFGGLSALLTMLNSCASGVAVVNIDNGFGAGYMASLINRLAQQS
ncbi:MAG: pyridinium-3,5-biscarboxylic acid mononucleotide synthase, partial [Clostridiales bacterium]|nr:pyridinium-3,5-biscarboxylic acid mononucleotide synthase [Clostridiales bacterium]